MLFYEISPETLIIINIHINCVYREADLKKQQYSINLVIPAKNYSSYSSNKTNETAVTYEI